MPHGCRECQNPITGTHNGGLPFTEAECAEIFAELEKSYISGITFSGGDPLHPANVEEVTALAKEIKENIPTRQSGSIPVLLVEDIQMLEIIRHLDVCVTVNLRLQKGASPEMVRFQQPESHRCSCKSAGRP